MKHSIVVGLCLGFFGCGHDIQESKPQSIDAAPNSTTSRVSFADLQESVFKESCVQCHNEEVHKKGLDLTNYELVRASKYIDLANPDQSIMVTIVETNKMPPRRNTDLPRLSADQLELLRQWIADGALP